MRTRKETDLNFENVEQSQLEGHENIKSSSQIKPWKMFILIAATYSILIVVFSVFLRIPVLIPTPWITGIIFLYLAPVLLYSLSIMIRPWMVMAICFPIICLGELLWCIVYGSAGELLVYVVISLNSWGIGCLLISLLRNRNEAIAMLIGGLWVFPGLLVPTHIYYTLILNWNPLYMVAIALVTMVLNLIVIPASLALNLVLRKALKIQHLDDLLPLTSDQ
ncbi:MAG: hypothetical protein RTV31_04235 [Candidatus Thorarchaeota archaeon]